MNTLATETLRLATTLGTPPYTSLLDRGEESETPHDDTNRRLTFPTTETNNEETTKEKSFIPTKNTTWAQNTENEYTFTENDATLTIDDCERDSKGKKRKKGYAGLRKVKTKKRRTFFRRLTKPLRRLHAHAVAPYGRLLLHNKGFRYLWLSGVISTLGNWFSYIATLTLVGMISPEDASSGLELSILFATAYGPPIIFSSIAGVLADVFDRRKIMILSDAFRCVVILGFIFVQTDVPRYSWLLYSLNAMLYSASAFFDPCREGLLPNIVAEEDLMIANALDSVSWSSMTLLGSALGGFVTAGLGTTVGFVANACCFFLSAVFVVLLVREQSDSWKHFLSVLSLCGTYRAKAEEDGGDEEEEEEEEEEEAPNTPTASVYTMSNRGSGRQSALSVSMDVDVERNKIKLIAKAMAEAAARGEVVLDTDRDSESEGATDTPHVATPAQSSCSTPLPPTASSAREEDSPFATVLIHPPEGNTVVPHQFQLPLEIHTQLQTEEAESETTGLLLPKQRSVAPSVANTPVKNRTKPAYNVVASYGSIQQDQDQAPPHGSEGPLSATDEIAVGDGLMFSSTEAEFETVNAMPLNAKWKHIKHHFFSYWLGLRFLYRHPFVLSLVMVKGSGYFIAGAVELVNVKLAETDFKIGDDSATMMGILKAVIGVAGGLSPIFVERIVGSNPAHVRTIIFCSFICVFLGAALMLLATNIPVFLAANVILVIGCDISWVYSTSTLQRIVPDEFIGRIFSFDVGVMYNLAQLLATLLLGTLIDYLSLRVETVGFITAVMALIILLLWGLWFIVTVGSPTDSLVRDEELEKEEHIAESEEFADGDADEGDAESGIKSLLALSRSEEKIDRASLRLSK